MDQKKRLQQWRYRGIRIESYQEYIDLYEKAGGECQVCHKPLALNGEESEKQTAQLDHDHRTGEPKGILCARDNRAINEIERFCYKDMKPMGEYLIRRAQTPSNSIESAGEGKTIPEGKKNVGKNKENGSKRSKERRVK